MAKAQNLWQGELKMAIPVVYMTLTNSYLGKKKKKIQSRIKISYHILKHLLLKCEFQPFMTRKCWHMRTSESLILYIIIIQYGNLMPYFMLVNNKGVRVMVFNCTFNNISVILWQSALLVEETRVTLSHNAVSSAPRLSGIRIRNVSGDRHWLHRFINNK